VLQGLPPIVPYAAVVGGPGGRLAVHAVQPAWPPWTQQVRMLHLAVWGGVSRQPGCTTTVLHVDNCHGADAPPVQLSSVPKFGILQNRSEDGAEFFRRLLQFSEGS